MRGYYPPSPFVDTVSDRHNLLERIFADPDPRRAHRARPDDTKRDLGRNGTYLVIRQLDQNADALDDFLRYAAAAIAKDPRNQFTFADADAFRQARYATSRTKEARNRRLT